MGLWCSMIYGNSIATLRSNRYSMIYDLLSRTSRLALGLNFLALREIHFNFNPFLGCVLQPSVILGPRNRSNMNWTWTNENQTISNSRPKYHNGSSIESSSLSRYFSAWWQLNFWGNGLSPTKAGSASSALRFAMSSMFTWHTAKDKYCHAWSESSGLIWFDMDWHGLIWFDVMFSFLGRWPYGFFQKLKRCVVSLWPSPCWLQGWEDCRQMRSWSRTWRGDEASVSDWLFLCQIPHLKEIKILAQS